MKSIIYWHPWIYRAFMRVLLGKHYAERYRIIADLIEDDCSVVDVCCGDCRLHEALRGKRIDYLGVDFNASFVASARRRGLRAEERNLRTDDIPTADYIVMLSSLYQFIPQADVVLSKMVRAAKRGVILHESMKSYSASPSRIFSEIGKALNNPGDGTRALRFTDQAFSDLLKPYAGSMAKDFLSFEGSYRTVLIRK